MFCGSQKLLRRIYFFDCQKIAGGKSKTLITVALKGATAAHKSSLHRGQLQPALVWKIAATSGL